MKTKKLLILILTVVFICTTLLTPISALEADMNGTGDKGTMGSAINSANSWNGTEYVAVTIRNKNTGESVGGTTNYSNSNISGVQHFGTNTKSDYANGADLKMSNSDFTSTNPQSEIPQIVNGDWGKVEEYFTSDEALEYMAQQVGLTPEELASGDYVLELEPGAVFTYNGREYAMTATQMAKYQQGQEDAGMTDGTIDDNIGNLTNATANSAKLEEEYDGFNGVAGSGGGHTSATNRAESGYGMGVVQIGGGSGNGGYNGLGISKDTYDTMLEILGSIPSIFPNGVPTLEEIPEAIINLKNVYEYECDTDVISAIWVSSPTEVTPDNPCYITFTANGQEIKSDAVVMPADTSQLVWFKWHTPKTPQTVTVVYTIEGGMTGAGAFNCNVTKREEITPPDTQAHDTYKSVINKLPTPKKFADHPSEGYTIPKTPTEVNSASNSWSIWVAQWVEKLEDCPQCDGSSTCNYTNFNEHRPHLKCKSGKIDMGNWSWKEKTFTATLTATAVLKADDNAPTAYQMGNKKWLMKSGYGVNITLKTSVDISGDSIGYGAYTQAQTAYTLFPEFNYGMYDRLLEPTKIDATKSWLEFKENPFSQWESRVHFTPLWFPDGKYTIYAVAENAWTPAGELKLSSTDYVEIEGNVYDDWTIVKGSVD